jgi:hypothetical protein
VNQTRRVRARLTATIVITMALAGLIGCTGGGGGGGGGLAGYGNTGRYSVAVITESVTTIYYPTNVEAGTKAPVILWGNGTITQVSWYDGLLRHIASHGFIIAAANTSNAGSGQEMLAGLDNVTAKNGQAGSPLYNKVALDRVGATGHSQGGAGTMRAAKDPRVKTAFPIEGPGSPDGVHGPVMFFAGENDTTLAQRSLSAYNTLGRTPGGYAELAGASHLTPLGSGGGFRAGVTAWARWQLAGDAAARSVFVGANCGLCTSPAWSRYEANAYLT